MQMRAHQHMQDHQLMRVLVSSFRTRRSVVLTRALPLHIMAMAFRWGQVRVVQLPELNGHDVFHFAAQSRTRSYKGMMIPSYEHVHDRNGEQAATQPSAAAPQQLQLLPPFKHNTLQPVTTST